MIDYSFKSMISRINCSAVLLQTLGQQFQPKLVLYDTHAIMYYTLLDSADPIYSIQIWILHVGFSGKEKLRTRESAQRRAAPNEELNADKKNETWEPSTFSTAPNLLH